jgi:hypothetical protein
LGSSFFQSRSSALNWSTRRWVILGSGGKLQLDDEHDWPGPAFYFEPDNRQKPFLMYEIAFPD